jgi:hypothetical protein
MTGADKKPSREPENYQAKTLTANISNSFQSGTHIGNAVGQSFTYTANSLNM